MIKRIIFDVDNTLLIWKEEYWHSLNRVLDKINYSYTDNTIMKIKTAVAEYDKVAVIYDKKNMLEMINHYFKIKLPNNFIELLLEELSSCAEVISSETIETLEYLYGKYELVILTNWFAYSQINRLKKADILKYFNKIYAADLIKKKPHPESYITAANGLEMNECVMVGDSISNDIEGPIKLGMKAIYYDVNNHGTTLDVPSIINLKKLEELL